MKIFFLLALLAGSFSLTFLTRRAKDQKLNLESLTLLILIGYGLVVLTSLPLVWIDHWSLSAHALLILALTFVPGIVLARRLITRSIRFDLPGVDRNFFLVLVIAIGSIWLQRHGVYNVYATHDPAAYIGSTLNISRTGSFFHHNEMSALAQSGKAPHLTALLNRNNPPLVADKMGVIRLGNSDREAYHGVFGAPVVYAIAVEYFGEKNFIRVHWVHLLATFILLFSLLKLVTGQKNNWALLGVLLFATCPLIPGIFRETLSEPLAVVFFLGILLSLFKVTEDASWKYVLLTCVLASICVRISGAMYLPPFLLCALLFERNQSSSRYFIVAAVGVAAVLFTISFASAYYVRSIVLEHLKMLIPSVQVEAFPLSYVGLALGISGGLAVLVLYLLRKPVLVIVDAIRSQNIWSKVWLGYFAVLALGLAYRYGKLVTKLTQYYGEFPFISYHLESILFYFGPAIALMGLFYWFKRCYRSELGAFTFLQVFLPFIILFYLVIRFLPLDVQMNFQRYLIIEILPLAVLGTIAILAKTRRSTLARITYVASVAWGVTLTTLTNHPEICSGTFQYYGELVKLLHTVKQPVIIAVKPSWRELTLLNPLHFTLGVPVVVANHGFSYQESQAITELQQQGYEPILALEKPLNAFGNPFEGNREWRNWMSVDHCYQYSAFRLMAPPLELATTCFDISLYRAVPASLKTAETIQRSWAYQNSEESTPLEHWYGVTIDGRKACAKQTKAFEFGLVFDPENNFRPPQVELNGVGFDGVELVSSQPGKTKTGHRVLVRVPASRLSCTRQNVVDIYFLPYPGSPRVRPVRLVPPAALGAKSETLARAAH